VRLWFSPKIGKVRKKDLNENFQCAFRFDNFPRAEALKSFIKFQLSALYFSSLKLAPLERGNFFIRCYKHDAPLERFLIPFISVVLTLEESRVYRNDLITLIRLR